MNIALRDSSPDPDYLARLNAEQRRAVLHGDGQISGVLLVIAGAGSGKTNTLAHRVAHLVIRGADPRRILLMTFSPQAAAEMTKRIGRIAGEVMGSKASVVIEDLTFAGTFHSVGARLLREYAPHIGLDPAFTIHNREDSADLMNMARHELGLSQTESQFLAKGTCLSIYSRTVNARCDLAEVLAATFPWCVDWEAELEALFAAYVDAKKVGNVLDYDDLLLYWAEMTADVELAADLGARFDHILVDEGRKLQHPAIQRMVSEQKRFYDFRCRMGEKGPPGESASPLPCGEGRIVERRTCYGSN